jgi:precorrin-3B C17-methyltransferase
MKKGEIYVVSTGMGNTGSLTGNALELLNKADMVVGYTKYISNISGLIQGKEIYATGMTHEVERCKYAIKQALEFKKVALISNGDVNVYGMAGLVLEIMEENNLWDSLDFVIEPGITSFLAAASKAGAPVMTDFAIISLSNLLTPIELIEKRIKNAMEADFVIGLYNPLSHSRQEPYEMFLKILEELKNPENPIITARDLGRKNELIKLITVKDLIEININIDKINMSTVLIIGNSSTKFINKGKNIVTQRGYQKNYEYKF